ncbi:TraB/GumN family protein [Duganella sp. PWIR1]
MSRAVQSHHNKVQVVGFLLRSLLLTTLFHSSSFALEAGVMPPFGGVPAYEIRAPNGELSLVIGSLHVPHAELRQPALSVLDAARVYVVEHVENQPQAPSPLADARHLRLGPDGVTRRADWAASLSDVDVETLRANLSCATGVQTPQSFMDLLMLSRSARLFSMIAYSPCAPPGMMSRDSLLQRAADQRGVATVALETQEAIEKRRASISERVYRATLHHALTMDIDKEFKKIVQALNDGDFEAIVTINEQVVGTNEARRYYRIMVKERNQAWMAPLKIQLNQGRAVVLVGAAHLPGREGILALLAKSGYRIREVRLPAADTVITPTSDVDR